MAASDAVKSYRITSYNVCYTKLLRPLYTYLTSEQSNPDFAGDITWNFNKFLIDANGKIVARFASKETPESPEVTKAIEAALEAKSAK